MRINDFTKRQRFLSEQIDIKKVSNPFDQPKSPPSPKIQPLKLLAEDELEELDILASEDFQPENCNDFSIQFSTTAEEGSPPAQEALDQKFKRKEPGKEYYKNKFEKKRSRSHHKLASVCSIYDYLTCKNKKI